MIHKKRSEQPVGCGSLARIRPSLSMFIKTNTVEDSESCESSYIPPYDRSQCRADRSSGGIITLQFCCIWQGK